MTGDFPKDPVRTSISRESVKARFGFEGWPRPAPAPERLPRERFIPSLDALPGLELAKRFPHRGRAFSDHIVHGNDPSATLDLMVWEEASAADAQERLLDFLGTSMAPSLPTLAERGLAIGDVGFADHDTPISMVVFARGRIVLRLLAPQGRGVPVVELAEALDQQIQAHLARLG